MRRSGVRLLLPAPENAKRPPLRVAVLFCCKAASARTQTAPAAAVSFLCARCPPCARCGRGEAKPSKQGGQLVADPPQGGFFHATTVTPSETPLQNPIPQNPQISLPSSLRARWSQARVCSADFAPKKTFVINFSSPCTNGDGRSARLGRRAVLGTESAPLRAFALPCVKRFGQGEFGRFVGRGGAGFDLVEPGEQFSDGDV